MKFMKNVFQEIKNTPLTPEDHEAYLYTFSIKGNNIIYFTVCLTTFRT